MLKALLWKELRETAGIAAVGLLVYAWIVSGYIGHSILPILNFGPFDFPFIDDGFVAFFCFISAGLAVWLGLRQTATESARGTWLFLLHRPAARRQLIGTKLAVGLSLYLICAALPILVYAWWADAPGNHASPFYCWLTADAWKAWSVIALVYLGAFLSGIRPGRWFGTRLAPLAGMAMLAVFVGVVWWVVAGPLAVILLVVLLVGVIFFVARTRDFS